MNLSTLKPYWHSFLGSSPDWYKFTIIGFLILNPILFLGLEHIPQIGEVGPTIAGWVLILEFIFTLAMALQCYPLQPGGLLALQAVLLGMTSADMVYKETVDNFPVIMLLMFMVAGIYFMKELLLFIFAKLLVGIRSKLLLSLLFSFVAAFLSAFLDALTVTAVLISVGVGFFVVYHRVASGLASDDASHDHTTDSDVKPELSAELEQFRAYLRSLLMHGAVGTALGGACTLVGEPQNLKIAKEVGWEFMEFFWAMAPITMPVLVCGLITCALLEITKVFGYGTDLPEGVRTVLSEYQDVEAAKATPLSRAQLVVQALVAIILVVALSQHLAEVGLIGLMIIVLLTAFTGVTDEHKLGHAFTEALPFTALLVVFFAIVAVIHDLHLFEPVIKQVLAMDANTRPAYFFLANGLLSAISDNVFVATVYIGEVKTAFLNSEANVAGAVQISREQFEQLAVAINTGTNLPSVATPNGQAAFLFLLTSALAPLIRLSYGRMVWMALPYTVVLTGVGLLSVMFLL
jgi:NhaB family Na+:H+ antiporter